jgi:hypothetical protein
MILVGPVRELIAASVEPRPIVRGAPMIYSGTQLRFADRAFDLVYAVDVFHHCPNPVTNLGHALRCCDMCFPLKHHASRTTVGWAAPDEPGNCRYGVPSVHAYQRGLKCVPENEAAGFRSVVTWHPAPCHGGLLGRPTNGLRFAGLRERSERP